MSKRLGDFSAWLQGPAEGMARAVGRMAAGSECACVGTVGWGARDSGG